MLLITFDSFKKNTFDTFWTPICYSRTLLDGNWTLGVLEVFQKCSKSYLNVELSPLASIFQNGGTHLCIKQKHSKKVCFLIFSVSTQWLGCGSTWIIHQWKWSMSVELNKDVLILRFYDNKKIMGRRTLLEHVQKPFPNLSMKHAWALKKKHPSIFSIAMLYIE